MILVSQGDVGFSIGILDVRVSQRSGLPCLDGDCRTNSQSTLVSSSVCANARISGEFAAGGIDSAAVDDHGAAIAAIAAADARAEVASRIDNAAVNRQIAAIAVLPAADARTVESASRGDVAAVDVYFSCMFVSSAADCSTVGLCRGNQTTGIFSCALGIDCERVVVRHGNARQIGRISGATYRQSCVVAKNKADLPLHNRAGAQRDVARDVVPAVLPDDGGRRIYHLVAGPRERSVRRQAVDGVAGLGLLRIIVRESGGLDGRDRIGDVLCVSENVSYRNCASIVLRSRWRNGQLPCGKRKRRIVRTVEIKRVRRNAAGNRVGERNALGLADLHRAKIRLRRDRIGSRDRQRVGGVEF